MGVYIFISILILLTALLLMLVVLVQNSKGGGLASNFAGSNQYMGVRKTADFLEKATWTLAIVLLVLSLSTVFVIPRNQSTNNQDTELRSVIGEEADRVPVDYIPQNEETETPAE
ncbi:MAG: preprotein translocase subunit SecG [Bacteroidales bacterium]|nr:preprotein translocase subunit SecG [Bacteroidales bacterium]